MLAQNTKNSDNDNDLQIFIMICHSIHKLFRFQFQFIPKNAIIHAVEWVSEPSNIEIQTFHIMLIAFLLRRIRSYFICT